MNYNQVVRYLESLTIMPDTMPGLDRIRGAAQEKTWWKTLDPQKIITVAGTNGKGTTAAALEALLLAADKKVGLYTSPHLVTTSERIRVEGKNISAEYFVEVFLQNKKLIEKYKLSHFESLTLMASDYFFQNKLDCDYVIFEVGLGGTYDATNIFPNKYSIITKIGVDHENILGKTLPEIAKNKFGIVKNNSIVIHHALESELSSLIEEIRLNTNSRWIKAEEFEAQYDSESDEWGNSSWKTNLAGARAIENISTAITIFKNLGFDFKMYKEALKKINWPGRMQKINWPGIKARTYLSGDHNPQGVQSLIDIIQNYSYQNLHIVIGIGIDKACDEMLRAILRLPRLKLYLTETPFRGRPLKQYPAFARDKSAMADAKIENILNGLKAESEDMVVVTGSLYLVGAVLASSIRH